MKVGATIIIPDPAAIHPRPSVVVPAAQVVLADDSVDVATSVGQTYRVKNGDTLYTIAKRILGSGGRADALFELNRDVIGSNPRPPAAGHAAPPAVRRRRPVPTRPTDLAPRPPDRTPRRAVGPASFRFSPCRSSIPTSRP